MWCWRPAQIGPHQATNEAVELRVGEKKLSVVGLILYTMFTTHNGPYIEQCTDLDGATHVMMIRCGDGRQPKVDLTGHNEAVVR